jgi:hypothetical protein
MNPFSYALHLMFGLLCVELAIGAQQNQEPENPATKDGPSTTNT